MQVIAFNTLILEDANLRGRTPCAKCEETEEFASSALTAAEALLGIINQVRSVVYASQCVATVVARRTDRRRGHACNRRPGA